MSTLLIILGVLFLILVIGVPLVERFSSKEEGRDYGNISRFVFPLMAVLIIVQMIRYYFS